MQPCFKNQCNSYAFVSTALSYRTMMVKKKTFKMDEKTSSSVSPGVQRVGTGGVSSRSLTQLQSIPPLHLHSHTNQQNVSVNHLKLEQRRLKANA